MKALFTVYVVTKPDYDNLIIDRVFRPYRSAKVYCNAMNLEIEKNPTAAESGWGKWKIIEKTLED